MRSVTSTRQMLPKRTSTASALLSIRNPRSIQTPLRRLRISTPRKPSRPGQNPTLLFYLPLSSLSSVQHSASTSRGSLYSKSARVQYVHSSIVRFFPGLQTPVQSSFRLTPSAPTFVPKFRSVQAPQPQVELELNHASAEADPTLATSHPSFWTPPRTSVTVTLIVLPPKKRKHRRGKGKRGATQLEAQESASS